MIAINKKRNVNKVLLGGNMKKSILMITPENKEIHRFRKRQINNFIQITMPYLAKIY